MATMPTSKKRDDFFESEDGQIVLATLREMSQDSTFNTESSYSANSNEYPDNRMPFLDKHVNYLLAHPKLDARMYVANLRLMTRSR
jgi:hypothetical protein